MIVPDKKTEAYLNRKAEQSDIVRLCRAGILSSADFLRASALCRQESEWMQKARRTLAFFSGVSFFCAAFFLILCKWNFSYIPSVSLLLMLLFFVCVSCHRYAIAEYAGAGIISALIFLPDLIFGTMIRLHEQAFVLFVLLLLWAIPSRRAGIRLLPLIAANVALGSFGVCVADPVFQIPFDSFCILAALTNVLLLIGRELSLPKTLLFHSCLFRFFPLLFACLFLLAGMVVQMNEGGFSLFAACFVLTAFSTWFYGYKHFDLCVCRLFLFFGLVWLVSGVHELLPFAGFSLQAEQAFLLSVVSVFVCAGFILNRYLVFCEREAEDVE